MSDATEIIVVTCPDCGLDTRAEVRSASTYIQATCVHCGGMIVGYMGTSSESESESDSEAGGDSSADSDRSAGGATPS